MSIRPAGAAPTTGTGGVTSGADWTGALAGTLVPADTGAGAEGTVVGVEVTGPDAACEPTGPAPPLIALAPWLAVPNDTLAGAEDGIDDPAGAGITSPGSCAAGAGVAPGAGDIGRP